MNNRVKYYSKDDMCYGLHLDKIEVLTLPDFKDVTINDAIEFHEINRYFDDGARSKLWSDEKYSEYLEKCKQLKSISRRFFNQINDTNILDVYNMIELNYRSEFWELFDICKLYNKITEEKLECLINNDKVSPLDMFKYKNFVKKYGCILRDYILNHSFCLKILLHFYEQDYTDDEKLFLPNELTGNDAITYIESYVNSDVVNTNYLKDIENMRATEQFPISDEIRLLAKRRYEAEIEKIFNSNTSIKQHFGYKIEFNCEQTEEKKITNNNSDGIIEYCLSYSLKWLEDTLDYPSILNNFIYIFEFADYQQMRSLHVSKKRKSGIIEDIFLPKSSRYYNCNQVFKTSETFANMQMVAYYEFLIKKGIYLEEVLKWFFTEYLQNEFSCPEMRVFFPSKCSSYYEKCVIIVTAFETILKQYTLYLRNNNIDFDLVAMSSNPVLFRDVKSQIENKYIYGKGIDYNRLIHMLFSNQNILSFLNRIYEEGKHYDCFFDLLINEILYLYDYREEDRKLFDYLENFDIVYIDENGKIQFKNINYVIILKDLYINEVISKRHYPLELQQVIDELIEKDVLIEESSLFSRPEVDYLNYMLNRVEFINGLEIRNKYIHGIQQVNMNEEEHKQNYMIFLRLFILLAIKINDEFCIKDLSD